MLGQFAVCREGTSIEISSRAAQSLLAYLILNAGVRHRREWLAGMFWPELEETRARKRLRHALWQLRRAVGDDYFDADRITVTFNAEADYDLDVDVLRGAVRNEGPADELLPIVDAYGGNLLPGFYDDWVLRMRANLRLAYEQQMQLLMCRLEVEGRWQEMVGAATTWLAHDDAAEAAYRALMLAHDRLGENAAVVAAFRACQEALQREFGVSPAPGTCALFTRLTQEKEGE